MAALGDVLLAAGGAACVSGGVVWLAAALLLVSLLCAEGDADDEVDDAGAFEFMLLAEDAAVASLVWGDEVLGLEAAGAALAAFEPAAVVSLLVDGLAAVLEALLAVLSELVSVLLLGLLIDEVGPALLPAPQWSATSFALLTWKELLPLELALVPALGLLAELLLGFEADVLSLAALLWPVSSTWWPTLSFKLSVLPVKE